MIHIPVYFNFYNTVCQSQMRLILSNQSINFTDISFQLSDSLNGTAVTVEITLPSENQTEEVTQLLQYYSFSFSMLGSYAISDNNRGIQAISASCESRQYHITLALSPDPTSFNFAR